MMSAARFFVFTKRRRLVIRSALDLLEDPGGGEVGVCDGAITDIVGNRRFRLRGDRGFRCGSSSGFALSRRASRSREALPRGARIHEEVGEPQAEGEEDGHSGAHSARMGISA